MSTANRRIQVLSNQLKDSNQVQNNNSIEAHQTNGNASQPQPFVYLTELDDERKKASFDVSELTTFLDGGDQMYQQMRELAAAAIKEDEVLFDTHRSDMSRPEIRERTMAKIRKTMEMWNQGNTSTNATQRDMPRMGKKRNNKTITDAFFAMMNLYDPSWSIRVGVHFGLFIGAIMGQGTQEQQEKWMPLCQSMKVTGCFAMTELGHGSYIQGFETTSTYNNSSKTFVINSPTQTSTKWWLGGAAHTATHAICFARLILDGKDFGINQFIVPLRKSDGSLLPGIEIGDCGSKMGRNGIDNGWIQFHNCSIPRENMLMKWTKVSEDGKYEKPPKAQLSYGALIGGRVGIIQDSADAAKKALTIAIRYGAVRRQFVKGDVVGSGTSSTPVTSGNIGKEQQLLDYQTHQYRLFIPLATCYAYHFTADYIRNLFEQMNEDLNKQDLTTLPGVHASSAGLKAFSTWWCNEVIEQCRQSLGGHGYSSYSGLPSLLSDFAINCTWEGDNTVLAQQTSKFVMKCVSKLSQGTKLNGMEKYLMDIAVALKQQLPLWKNGKTPDLTDVQDVTTLLSYEAFTVISQTGRRLFEERKTKGKSDGWNECQQDLVLAARAHCDVVVVQCFATAISNAKNPAIASVLKKLFLLHSLSTSERYVAFILGEGQVPVSLLSSIRHQVRELCTSIRPDAVSLVDALAVPDVVLNSPLGAFDGQIYKNYFETVKSAPNAIGVPPYWKNLVQPMLQQS